MKKFLIKTLVFLGLPFSLWAIAEAWLPATTFTFRHYEALQFEPSVPHIGSNYPNINSSMVAVGDLCHHSSKAIQKDEYWRTDQLGYRNDQFVENPDVVFIGDSFLQGSSLSQPDILINQLKPMLPGLRLYAMAPCSVSLFDYYITSGIIKKPKIVVYEIVERNLPEPLVLHKSRFGKLKDATAELLSVGDFNVVLSKIIKAQSVSWLRARVSQSVGKGIPGALNPNMFFLKGTKNGHNTTDAALTTNVLTAYQSYFASHGIAFIFLPMPDKETVYYDWAGFSKQPDYLLRLDALLKQKKIASINTLAVYNHYREQNQTILYHLDDTHWNRNGVSVLAPVIAQKIKETQRQIATP